MVSAVFMDVWVLLLQQHIQCLGVFPSPPYLVGTGSQRSHLFMCIFAFLFRVFLRAINKFAETMNQKFLENMNFEVQVSIQAF